MVVIRLVLAVSFGLTFFIFLAIVFSFLVWEVSFLFMYLLYQIIGVLSRGFFDFFEERREVLTLLVLYDLVAVNACLGRDRLNLHITGGVVSHNRALGHGVVLAISHIVASSRQSLGNDFHNLLLGGILGVDLLHFLVSHSINSFLVCWVFLPCDYIVPQFRRFVKNFFLKVLRNLLTSLLLSSPLLYLYYIIGLRFCQEVF